MVLALRCARALRRWALASGSALLAVGCAVPAPGAPSGSPGTTGAAAVTATSAAAAVAALGAGFTLEGRISVNYGAQNLSGKVRWSHDAASDDIALASPLGTQVARLVRDSSGVALTDSEQVTHRAGDAESLTEQRLGWRLPLTGLSAWVRGRSLSGRDRAYSWIRRARLGRGVERGLSERERRLRHEHDQCR